jgi:hypothetical protein
LEKSASFLILSGLTVSFFRLSLGLRRGLFVFGTGKR